MILSTDTLKKALRSLSGVFWALMLILTPNQSTITTIQLTAVH